MLGYIEAGEETSHNAFKWASVLIIVTGRGGGKKLAHRDGRRALHVPTVVRNWVRTDGRTDGRTPIACLVSRLQTHCDLSPWVKVGTMPTPTHNCFEANK